MPRHLGPPLVPHGEMVGEVSLFLFKHTFEVGSRSSIQKTLSSLRLMRRSSDVMDVSRGEMLSGSIEENCCRARANPAMRMAQLFS